MSRTPKQPPADGILVIDKPSGKTSHDVVESVRQLAGFRGIGHLGTLDPQATGVLVLALGRATRLARFYTGRRKRYTCAVRFGFETDTYDADGEALGPDAAPALNADELAAYAARFVVECGAGTYIRSLAYELGKLQGSGAHLAEISRTAVGEFTLDQAVSLADLAQDARDGRLLARVIPLEKLLTELPRATILPVIEKRVRHGAKFNLTLAQIQQGQLIAIAEPVVPRTYQPVVVLEAAP